MISVVFGAQVFLKFWWELETVSERLKVENPKLVQRLEEKGNESLARWYWNPI